MMFIYLNLYNKLVKDDKVDKYSFYTWIMCYFIVLNIFIIREYGLITIESYFMLTGIIIVLVFVTTIMLSFYTIMKESNNWYYNIFPSVVLFWMLFHDSKNTWMEKNNFYMVIPFICMYTLKLINIMEKKSKLIKPNIILETIFYLILCFIEFLFCSDNNFTTWYYILVICIIMFDIFMDKEYNIVTFVLLSPFIMPVIIFYSLCAIRKRGVDEGISDIIYRLRNMHDRLKNKDEDFMVTMRDSMDIKNIL